jgi:branched-chain amino acid transport system substrate-binding protein
MFRNTGIFGALLFALGIVGCQPSGGPTGNETGKKSDSLTLGEAISRVSNYPGVSGVITIGPDGNARKPGLVLVSKVVDGKPMWVPYKRFDWFDPGLVTPKERPASPGPGNNIEGDTIKVGLIASLSGPERPWGEESRLGAQLAIEEANAQGGINGMKIELLVEDTGGDPAQGKSATERLIGEKRVLCVLGEVASGVTAPSAQVCHERGIPLISIGSTRVDITHIGSNVFRVCYTDDFQGAMMAKFAYEDLGLRNVAILTDRKLPYSVGLSEHFANYFKKLGGKIATEVFYEKGQTDFKAQLTNIKAANPDGLFCSGYFTEIGPIARQRMDVGLTVPMFGGDGWDSAELLQAGGTGIIGTYYSNHYSNLEDRPEVKKFVEAFRKRYGREPANAMAALGYDAAGVLVEALRLANFGKK